MYNFDNPSQHLGVIDSEITLIVLSVSAFGLSIIALISCFPLCQRIKRCERIIESSSEAFYLSEEEGREGDQQVLQLIQNTNSRLTELQSDIEQLKITADLLINQAAKQRKNGSKILMQSTQFQLMEQQNLHLK